VTTRRLLRGGLVADGVGDDAVRADVLIEDADILAVGPDVGAGVDAEVIELEPGSVVCPGFIDAHVHAERPLVDDGVVPGALAQGVTTLVIGQDGSSWVGGSAAAVDYFSHYFGPINGAAPRPGACSVADFHDMVSGRLVQNVAVLASQGTIRYNAAGADSRPLDASEVARARRELERALAGGAVGLSSGLDYVPSRFGSAEEIAAIAAPLRDADRPYVSHLRGYGPTVADGLAELGLVGRTAGVPVHASHLWGDPADIDAAIRRADADGVPMTYDMYPYSWSSTVLSMLTLPADILEGGTEAALRRLADPAVRADLLRSDRLTAEALGGVVLGSLPDSLARHAGRTVVEAAAADDHPPGEWTLDALAAAQFQVGAHLDRPTLTEDWIRRIVRHDRHCAGSDGIYQGQHPHPRGWGAFARLVGYYTNADGQTDYQQLVRHLSTTAADTYRLRRRGRLLPGHAADITVLSPTGLTETAAYSQPRELATGVALVLVNGATAWAEAGASRTTPPGGTIAT
jgi:N-acyl-D-amino-acid deacylase